jgi:ElaB/YqjD/DUF883 family membrane-anchored ribosome-binding protein
VSDLNKKSLNSAFSELSGMKTADLEDLENRLKEAKEKTTEFVRNYPLTSVAIGVGVGFLIGKMFSKK